MLVIVSLSNCTMSATSESIGKITARTGKVRACVRCHDAKTRCERANEFQTKCDRCLKLNRHCEPHVSIQGQRPKKDQVAKTSKKKKSKEKKRSMEVHKATEQPKITSTSFTAGASNNANGIPLCHPISGSQPMAPSTSAAWTGHLVSSLQAPPSTDSNGLEALLTSAVLNASTAGSQGGIGNLTVPEASSAHLLQQLLNQVGQQPNQVQQPDPTTTILSAIRNNARGILQDTPAPLWTNHLSFLQPPSVSIPTTQPIQNQCLSNLLQQVEQQKEEETKQQEHDMLVSLVHQELMKLNCAHQQGIGSTDRPDAPHEERRPSEVSNGTKDSDVDDAGDFSVNSIGTKRSSTDDKSLFTDLRFKKAKRSDVTTTTQVKNKSMSLSATPAAMRENIDPEVHLADHLVKLLCQGSLHDCNLKHHFGMQALIREWLATAFSTRSFGLLSKASKLALKFDIDMETVMSGVDTRLTNGNTNFAGGPLNHLLSQLLAPRAAQSQRNEEQTMLRPNLPRSLLSYIAPTCTSFDELDVGNRWILIRETCQGNTTFYCSPAFEKNILSWSHVSQIHQDGVADIFSLVFASEQEYGKFSASLSNQISAQSTESSQVCPVLFRATIHHLLSKSWSQIIGHDNAPVTKEMIDNTGPGTTIDVDAMLSGILTRDKHTYYLEFFGPNGKSLGGSDQQSSHIITPSPHLLPPLYDEVRKQF
ncbi:hypothetical protein ACHAWO_011517 [Cyclotella atomus]|uniref:Zn(2)-C6 fungal-type domain-containing protein n=1 Tax=Cyclotella atomus TaxID=382360 RepID=A0ABD3NJA2_9STRA